MTPPPAPAYLPPLAHFWAAAAATARLHVKRTDAYKIEIVRGPLTILTVFGVWRLTYGIAGREQVDGADAAGFLLVGMFGMMAWGATVWTLGYALVRERSEGTLGPLFVAPASRVALLLGYGLGQFALMARALVLLGALALASGARLRVGDPLALLAGVLAVPAATLATGIAFAGLFLLSRRGNLLANALQTPVWLLTGFVVPRDELHPWLQAAAAVLPVSHAVEALRAGSLRAAAFGEAAPDLALGAGTAVAWVLVAAFALRRVEHAARRAGSLSL